MSYLDSPIPSLLELPAQRLLNKNGWSIQLYSRKPCLLSSSPHYFQGSWRIFSLSSSLFAPSSYFCCLYSVSPFLLLFPSLSITCTQCVQQGWILGHTLRYAKYIFYFLKKSWWYSSLVQVAHFTSLPNNAVW